MRVFLRALLACMMSGWLQPVTALPLLYSLNPQDISIAYLNLLFGPLSGMGSATQMTAFSTALVLVLPALSWVACLVASYLFYTQGLSSANEGQGLGETWESLQIPIKSAAAMSLLTPDSNGYAFVQKLVMIVVLNGISVANQIWQTVITSYQQGYSLASPAPQSGASLDLEAAGQELLESLIELALLAQYAAQSPDGTNIRGFALTLSENQKFLELQVTRYSNSQPVTVATVLALPNIANYAAKIQNFFTILLSDPILTAVVQNNLSVTANKDSPLAQLLTSDLLSAWSQGTASQLKQMFATPVAISDLDSNLAQFLSDGWIRAGGLYWMLTQSSSLAGQTDFTTLCSTTGACQLGANFLQTSLLNTMFPSVNWDGTLVASLTTCTSNILTSGQGKHQSSQAILAKVLGEGQAGWNQFSQPLNFQSGADALLNLAQACQKLLTGFFGLLIAFCGGSAIFGAAAFAVSGVNPFPFLAFYIILAVVLVLMQIGSMLIPPAIIGAYIIPLVPTVVFSLACVGWVIKVIEAVIAAPVIVVAFLVPAQDEWGQAQASIMLLLSLFCRPALMLIGFVLAVKVLMLSITLTMAGVNAFLQVGVMSSLTDSIFGFIPQLIIVNIVVSGVMNLTMRAFSLVHALPDVFAQIGFGQRSGDEIQESVREFRSGAEEGIKAIKEILSMGKTFSKTLQQKGLNRQMGDD